MRVRSVKTTVPTPNPRRHWLITLPSAAAVIFIVCALAAPQQRFVAIWCTLAACAIVTTVFMLCLQLVLSDIAAHAATVHARLDTVNAGATQTLHVLENLTGAMATLAPSGSDSEFTERLAHLERSVGRLRKLLSAQVTADITSELRDDDTSNDEPPPA